MSEKEARSDDNKSSNIGPKNSNKIINIFENQMFEGIKIKAKFLIAFLSIIIPASIIIGYSALVASTNATSAQYISSVNMPNALLFIELEKDVILIQSWFQNIGLTRGASGYNQGFTEAEKHYYKADKIIDDLLKKNINMPEQHKQIEQMKVNLKNYYDVGKEVANSYIQAGSEAGNAMLEAFGLVRKSLNDILIEKRQTQTDDLIKTINNINEELNSTRNSSLFLVLAFIIFGIAIALYMAEKLVRPVKKMNKSLYDISEGDGDLTIELEVKSKDELGEMALSFNRFIVKLREVIKEVKNGSKIISDASIEINTTAQGISEGANNQAANVEEISSSLEEIAAGITQNADNSKHTDTIASESAKQAGESGAAVDQSVKAMRKIADKIGLVEDISYKTNLLALNAAIEAARAGEHGKGFAVVANEVRNLAEKTQIASKEISDLSGESLNVSEKSGDLLKELVPNITKTADLVQDIASATEQQNSSVDQINIGMEQLNEITQENAASSEELAATSDMLKVNAENLQMKMEFFKIE